VRRLRRPARRRPVANEVLHAIEGNAIEAAREAAEQMRRQRQELRKSIEGRNCS
jgi:hypothetical protein